MKIGKIDTHKLQTLILDQIKYRHPDVLVRGAIGEDCAVVSFGEQNLIITTDPITGTSSEIGGLSIDIVCNDLASNGVKPLGILLTLLVPESTTEQELLKVMTDASKRASELEVEIIGGHTEVTSAVTRIVISATAIGRQSKTDLVHNLKSQSGDVILLTKSAGLEGIGIIAYEKNAFLKDYLTESEMQTAKGFLKRTSVVAEGIVASGFKPSAMHDVTEGGILGAIYELCEASGLGCNVIFEQIPIENITRKICSIYKIDPLKLISSGAMLIVIAAHKATLLMDALCQQGIECTHIGQMTAEAPKKLWMSGLPQTIEPPQSDALYQVLV